MERHADLSTRVIPATESEASDGAAEFVVCDLPSRLPVTRDEIDAVLFHARDLIEALMDIGSTKSH